MILSTNNNLEALKKRQEDAARRFERAKNDYKRIASQLSEAERKARTRRLIQLGGLCQMVLGDTIDAGLLTGLLIKNKNIFENGNAEIKLLGDTLISEKEEERKRG